MVITDNMELLYRSHMSRICKTDSFGKRLCTPSIVPVGRDGPLSIQVDDDTRKLRVGPLEIEQGAKIMPPLSVDTPGTIRDHGDGIVSIRLPVPTNLSLLTGARLLIVENAFELRRDPRALARTVSALRRAAGPRPLLYLQGIAEPGNLALLCYMGVDLVDDILPRLMAARGVSLRPEGHFRSEAPPEILEDLNLQEMDEELELLCAFIMSDRLRELVDQRAPSSTFNVVALRVMDNECWEFTEEYVPVTGGRFSCNDAQSLERPDVKRWRRRIDEVYCAPKHEQVLVLLPCSARKPYFTSRSHRRFINAIRSGEHFGLVHELIVTSPLGLVPRELETFFPAAHYNIPVSGEWSCQEKEIIFKMLDLFVRRNGYREIVSHLGDGGLLTGSLDVIDTSEGDPGSDRALSLLDKTLRELCSQYETVSAQEDRRGNMASMLRFQFGDGANCLMEGSTVVGKYPFWKLMDGKVQLAMHTPDRGMASLTLKGAERLREAGINIVRIGDFMLKGNVFAVGVTEADRSIRVGDEVVVEQHGQLAAVGVAQMNGREMMDLDRGMAVKVRHQVA
jgi:archaeosine synthase